MAEWIDTEEAAKISGYHIDHIRLLLREKKVGGKKKGGAYWVDKQSLLDYIAAASQTDDKRHGAKGKPTSAT